ncbi:MAG: DUF4912 domain-containing protein [Pyrinomonadaceae bacterium]|nr:DUF4912 domain-containing protein [Pyrinomonadaceae bacterium]
MSQEEREPLNLILEDFKLHLVSSAELVKSREPLGEENKLKFAQENEENDLLEELESGQLPALPPRNRAQLQIQSPNKVRFYWSLKSNPFSTLEKILGDKAFHYRLVAKLINQTEKLEKIFPIDVAGSAWFDVDSDSTYQVEVGFFAPGRPFIRLLFSNVVQTPRNAPSKFFDWSAEFAISTKDFVRVLDVTGFKQDAIELALSSDDLDDASAKNTFISISGTEDMSFDPLEIRYALFALASGLSLEDLRGRVSAEFFAFLQRLALEMGEASLASRIKTTISESFGISQIEEEEISQETFGASLVEFRRRKPSRRLPKISPVSSLR